MTAPLLGPVPPPGLAVMTWNVRRPMGALAWPPADRWSRREPLVRDALARERPTLLAAQEVVPATAATLLEGLGPGYRLVGRGRGRTGRGEGCPILWDAARLDLLDAEQLALSDRPAVPGSRTWGNPFPRVAVAAVFRDRQTSARFLAVSTHLDPLSRRSRARSVGMLAALVTRRGLPAIVLGDVNTPVDAPELAGFDGVVSDAWDRAAERVTPAWGTFGGYRRPARGARIDALLVTDDLPVARIGIDGRSIGGGWPSDHLPVQAVIHPPVDTAGGTA